MSENEELVTTLDEAVKEVLGLLTGLDLTYRPELDRYQAITRQLNRALRSVAHEHEWSYYSDDQIVGTATFGDSEVIIPSSLRPRIIGDDAVRLVNHRDQAVVWAYFLPRDALHKYVGRAGLWCSIVRNRLEFSRAFHRGEHGLNISVPVMREPVMFRLPVQSEDPNDPIVLVPDEIREQPVDFPYPDLIILRAAFFYAQTDPIMQPRVQTIEEQYKDLMYQIIERDTSNTDTPYQNEFFVPVQGSLDPAHLHHWHPHSDERR